MTATRRTPESVTPSQAAEYLQVSRGTIYRYIRRGRLKASRIGRGYSIPRQNLDSLPRARGTPRGPVLRDYTAEEIAEFIRADQLDAQARAIVERFSAVMDRAARGRGLARPTSR